MTQSLQILRKIGYPTNGDSFNTEGCEITEEEFHIARKNKVAALLVQRCNGRQPTEESPDYIDNRLEYMDRVERALETLEEKLPSSGEVALVKSSLPFWVDASDIDILAFDSESILDLRETLEEDGYTIKGQSPTAIGALDPETDIEIDAQTNFSAQHVTYFDASTLSGDIEHREVYGSVLPCVALPKDLALITVHSITEQMFTMKEYYAALSILERMSEDDLQVFQHVINENHAEPAVSAFFSVISGITEQVFETKLPYSDWFEATYEISEHRERSRLTENEYSLPHNYSVRTFLEFCSFKMRNPLFRQTALRQMVHFADPRDLKYFVSKVVERRSREHYAHDYDG